MRVCYLGYSCKQLVRKEVEEIPVPNTLSSYATFSQCFRYFKVYEEL